MEGQGVAAPGMSRGFGRQGESGLGAVVAAQFDQPAESHVTTDIADGGEGQGRNGDDSHVMVAPGHPEASAQDVNMSQSPDSSQPPRPSREQQSSQESQPELPSQQIKSDKADNIVDPDRNNSAVARDENTGHNQTAAGLAPPAVDAPAENTPAADAPAADAPTAGSASPSEPAATDGSVPPGTGEPETVQFAAIPPEPEPGPSGVIVPEPGPGPSGVIVPEPVPARPEPSPSGSAEPETVQFPAVPAEDAEPVSDSAPAEPAEPETAEPESAPSAEPAGSGSPLFLWSSRSPVPPRSRSNAAS